MSDIAKAAPAVVTVASQAPAPKPAAAPKKAPAAKAAPQAAKPSTSTAGIETKPATASSAGEAKNLLAEAGDAVSIPKKSLAEKVQELANKYEDKRKKKSAITNVDDKRTPDKIQPEAGRIAPAADEVVEEDPAAAPVTLAEQMAAEGLAPLPAGETVEGDPVAEVPAVEGEWKPDFKIKALKFERPDDAKATEFEAEIPENFRSLITDAESEKQVKELFSKSHSFDFLKEKNNRVQAQRDQGAQFLDTISGRLQNVDRMIAQNDLESVFQVMAIPKEKVLQYVLDDLTYQQLPPDQKQLIDAQRASESRTKSLEQQNQRLAQGQMKAMIKAKNMELDAILARPDVSQVMMAYDSRPGKPAEAPSFRDLVINQGEIAWHRSGGKLDLSSHEAVEAVLRDYGLRQAYGTAAAEIPAPAQTAARAPAPAAKPAPAPRAATPRAQNLPNVSSRATSPTTPRIKTRAELEARIKQVMGS